jgi:hypothetical protein
LLPNGPNGFSRNSNELVYLIFLDDERRSEEDVIAAMLFLRFLRLRQLLASRIGRRVVAKNNTDRGGVVFHLVLAPPEILGRDPSAQIIHRLRADFLPGKRSLQARKRLAATEKRGRKTKNPLDLWRAHNGNHISPHSPTLVPAKRPLIFILLILLANHDRHNPCLKQSQPVLQIDQ